MSGLRLPIRIPPDERNLGAAVRTMHWEPQKHEEDKKITMFRAVGPEGEGWKMLQTTKMPNNFLIEKGESIMARSTGQHGTDLEECGRCEVG